VAAGLYNPVILKRFSEVFQAKYQMELLNTFYKTIEDKLLISCDIKMPIYRKFFSIEEQNNWFAASDKPNLAPFLSTKVIVKKYERIINQNKFFLWKGLSGTVTVKIESHLKFFSFGKD